MAKQTVLPLLAPSKTGPQPSCSPSSRRRAKAPAQHAATRTCLLCHFGHPSWAFVPISPAPWAFAWLIVPGGKEPQLSYPPLYPNLLTESIISMIQPSRLLLAGLPTELSTEIAGPPWYIAVPICASPHEQISWFPRIDHSRRPRLAAPYSPPASCVCSRRSKQR